MKKITLTIIIPVVLLLFSGCDAMLEFFYPEYADDNAVNITISITTGDITDHNYDTTIPLLVELYVSGETPAADAPVRSVELYNKFDNYLCTLFVPAGTYDIWIWQDDNKNGIIDGVDDEFVLSADLTTPP
ncbi:MAG: hypothetical protein KAR21_25580 [Spirochaetales bacterium]|nr:hypothetical protein [Spirochaetales bacterium]